MQQYTPHNFHLPVMGLSFSIDSPLKVARFGIASVLSLSDDALIEQMRQYYSQQYHKPFTSIPYSEEDYRAKRITAYLNLVDQLVKEQVETLRQEAFEPGTGITKYFEMLPDNSPLKLLYLQMLQEENDEEQAQLQAALRKAIVPGSIDVNIMTKLDRTNYTKSGEALPPEYSDALAALRGYANSTVKSSIVFSAGMNMRLYGYIDQFPSFQLNEQGSFDKKIIIKVSDYRSALIQGKILAKKGLWVSEYLFILRIL